LAVRDVDSSGIASTCSFQMETCTKCLN
jgi:hypothetical protein